MTFTINTQSNSQAPESAPADEPLFKPPNPPANEPPPVREARLALSKAYALAGGQQVRVIAAPFQEERDAFISLTRKVPLRIVQQVVWCRNDQTIDARSESYGIDNDEDHISLLSLVTRVLRLRFAEIEGPGSSLLDQKMRVDVVVRSDTTRNQAVEPLARAFREQLRVPVRFELRNETRDVWVVRGKAKGDLPGQNEQSPIQIYGKDPPEPLNERNTTVLHRGDSDTLFDHVGAYIGRQVVKVDDSLLANSFLYFAHRRIRKTDSGTETDVIKKVTEQTGLSFTRERRDVRVLIVSRAG